MKCIKCGAEVADNVKFCSVCGSLIVERTEVQEESSVNDENSAKEQETVVEEVMTGKKKKARGKKGLALIGVAGALAVGAIVALSFGGNSKDSYLGFSVRGQSPILRVGDEYISKAGKIVELSEDDLSLELSAKGGHLIGYDYDDTLYYYSASKEDFVEFEDDLESSMGYYISDYVSAHGSDVLYRKDYEGNNKELWFYKLGSNKEPMLITDESYYSKAVINNSSVMYNVFEEDYLDSSTADDMKLYVTSVDSSDEAKLLGEGLFGVAYSHNRNNYVALDYEGEIYLNGKKTGLDGRYKFFVNSYCDEIIALNEDGELCYLCNGEVYELDDVSWSNPKMILPNKVIIYDSVYTSNCTWLGCTTFEKYALLNVGGKTYRIVRENGEFELEKVCSEVVKYTSCNNYIYVIDGEKLYFGKPTDKELKQLYKDNDIEDISYVVGSLDGKGVYAVDYDDNLLYITNKGVEKIAKDIYTAALDYVNGIVVYITTDNELFSAKKDAKSVKEILDDDANRLYEYCDKIYVDVDDEPYLVTGHGKAKEVK